MEKIELTSSSVFANQEQTKAYCSECKQRVRAEWRTFSYDGNGNPSTEKLYYSAHDTKSGKPCDKSGEPVRQRTRSVKNV